MPCCAVLQREYVSHSSRQFIRQSLPVVPARALFSNTDTVHRRIQQAQQPQQSRALCEEKEPLSTATTTAALSLTSHSVYGGVYADSAERRRLLPWMDWEEKEAEARQRRAEQQRKATLILTQNSQANDFSSAQSSKQGKACSGASGERLRVGGHVDPSSHSFVQRSWLPDRSHFSHYLAERIDVWAQSARIHQQQIERERTTRRQSVNHNQNHNKDRDSDSTASSDPFGFDRTRHSFHTAPALQPLYEQQP